MINKENETMAKKKITCWKCDGSGKIRAYSHIANGECFACAGLGYKVVNANHKPSTLYAVKIFADFNEDGNPFMGTVFSQKARTATEAKRKAIATLSRGCYADCIDSIEIE